MEYKSKYTASEIDAKLSQVFDSTLQTKEVEVSADTTIKADEGFLGLKEVSVKVNGGGGSASSWRYFSAPTITDQPSANLVLYSLALIVRTNSSVGAQIGSIFLMNSSDTTLDAIGIDTSRVVYINGFTPEPMQIEALFAMENGGVTFEQMLVQMLGIIEITEEEFYAL